MSKKKLLAAAILLVFAIVSNCLILNYKSEYSQKDIEISMSIKSDSKQAIKMYYSDTDQFIEEQSSFVEYKEVGEKQKLTFVVDNTYDYIRFDFGESESIQYTLSDVKMNYYGVKIESDIALFEEGNFQQVTGLSVADDGIQFTTSGTDCFCVNNVDWDVISKEAESTHGKQCMAKNIVICIVLDVFIIFAFLNIKKLVMLPIELISNRKLILQLSKNDLKTRFAGSYLGVLWAFVNPVITILVYWFVFQVGFKSSPIDDFPFLLWFVTGLIPWFFFSEGLSGGTNSLIEYSYLVKKVVFKISILPIVKIVAAFFIHVFFLAVLLVLYLAYGEGFGIHAIQILYYSLCMFALVLAISYTTSAIVIFFRDLSQVIGVVLQIGMWLTPIMWSYTMLPVGIRWILKINPMYYVVEGYRNTMIYDTWFWNNFYETAYFWLLTIGLFGLGNAIFNRLKVHFADVL